MARSNTLQLVITARETASREFGKLGKAIDTTRKRVTSLRKTMLNLKTAFAGLALGLLAKNLVNAANEQAKAVEGLDTALRSMGRYTPELSAGLQDVASSLQNVTNYGDEATIQGQKFLVTYRGITDDLLPRSSKAMLDLAALMGGDAARAANMLGKASMGMTGELRRVGITVDSNVYKTEGYLGVLKAIEGQVSGQAEAMRRATGPWIAIGNAIGDVREKLGELLKASFSGAGEDLLSTINLIDTALKDFLQGVDFKAIQAEIQLFVENSLLSMALFYDGIKPIISDIKTVLSEIWESFRSLPPWVQKVGLVGAFLGGKTGKVIVAGTLLSMKHIKNLAAASALVQSQQMPQELLNKLMWKPGDLDAYVKEWDVANKEIVEITGDAAKDASKPVKNFFEEFLEAPTATEKVKILLRHLKQLREEQAKPDAAKKVAKAIAPGMPVASDDATTKSHTARLIAATKTALLILTDTYADGEVTMQQYFARRLELIEKQYATEMAAMVASAAAESDPSKKLALEDQIFAKEQAHKQILIGLAREQTEAEKSLAQTKIELDQAMENLRARARGGIGGLLQVEYDAELAEMDARQAEELQNFKDLLNDKLAAELGYMDEASALRDVQGMQRAEKEKLIADQDRKIQNSKLENARAIASGMESIFSDLYEMSGEKQKEFFYLSKAAAMAEAGIKIAQGVIGALGSPPYGAGSIVMASIIAAAGAVQMAKITAQGFAAGGKIQGNSPSNTSDNIHIMATAGEYMQPVKTVQYYGTKVMDAMRKRLIPPEIFSGLSLPNFASQRPAYAFADGGPIPSQGPGSSSRAPGTMNGQTQPPINIINVTDPRDIDQYLSTSAGQHAILNVLSSRAETVKKVLR